MTVTRSLVLALATVALLLPQAASARRTITVRVPDFEVQPRQNREVCTFVPLPTKKALDLSEIVILNQGANSEFTTHHLIVYAYRRSLEPLLGEKGKIVDDKACLNFGTGEPGALQIVATSQGIRKREPMAKGTALRIDPQPLSGDKLGIGIVLNSHWINSSDRVQRAKAKVKLVLAKPRAVKKQLKPIFDVIANAALEVPPGEVRTVRGQWGPGLPDLGGGLLGGTENPVGPACVTMLIGHTHRRGTLFTATLTNGTTPVEELYRNTIYSDPPAKAFPKPLLVRPGQRIRYECTHDNATDPKLGCEEQPGVAPGVPVIRSILAGDGFSFGDTSAKGCTTLGPNPGECPAIDPAYPDRTFTGNCVQANVVFGFTSEDEMCILPGYYYDANPDAPPGEECTL
jgi:hypothetical protein